MRWDNLVENPATTGNSALFTADAVTTRTFDSPELRSEACLSRGTTGVGRTRGAGRSPSWRRTGPRPFPDRRRSQDRAGRGACSRPIGAKCSREQELRSAYSPSRTTKANPVTTRRKLR